MRKDFPVSFRQRLCLDSYIRVEEVKNEKGQVVSRFVRFNLDQAVIDKILQARTKQQDLSVGTSLLAQLRSYALLDAENRLQSGLTFCTYYYESLRREFVSETIVMRSVISLDGDIIHQIRQDCLEDSTWCLALATAHHWLIHQLLNQLYFKSNSALLLNGLSWGLSLLISVPMAIRHIDQLNLWTLLAPILMSWLLQVGFKELLRLFLPSIRRWILRQLLLRLLSANSLENKIAKSILGRFGL